MYDGIGNLKDEVVKKAKSQAIAIIGEAKAEALRITKEAEKKLEAYRKKSEEDVKRAIEQIKRRELMAAELEAKKMQLESKKKIIESVIEKVKSRIASLKDSESAELINALYKEASKEIDVATVYCNNRDSRFIKGAEVGIQEMLGGIIAESSDKRIRVDYSFETILEQVKEDSFKEMNKILFENAET